MLGQLMKTEEETQEIIKEVVGGINKKFNYDESGKIDHNLYKLYLNYDEDTKSQKYIYFTNNSEIFPRVSLEQNGNPDFIISGEFYTVYIYDKKPSI